MNQGTTDSANVKYKHLICSFYSKFKFASINYATMKTSILVSMVGRFLQLFTLGFIRPVLQGNKAVVSFQGVHWMQDVVTAV